MPWQIETHYRLARKKANFSQKKYFFVLFLTLAHPKQDYCQKIELEISKKVLFIELCDLGKRCAVSIERIYGRIWVAIAHSHADKHLFARINI